ncbi:MAG: HAMP domain-containing histidine kinase [Planctomycetota bacterium]|nr:HAMP domain-containing histidine kinase [Planctomycetota bacterium]
MNGETGILQPEAPPATRAWNGLALRTDPAVAPHATLKECLEALKRTGAPVLLVLEDERPAGALSAAILLDAAIAGRFEARARDLMAPCGEAALMAESLLAAQHAMSEIPGPGLALLGPDGRFLGWLGRSELAQYESQHYRAQLRKAQRVMDEMRQEIEHIQNENVDIMGIMAHDLRGPLGCVLNAAQFLLDKPADLTPAQADKFTRIVVQEAQHLLEITKDVMAFTQNAQGRLKLSLEACSPVLVMARAAGVYASMAERKGIAFEMAMPAPEHLPVVYVDLERIHTVVSNLLDNAVKYCRKDDRIRFVLEHDHETVTFVVADNGQGLAKAELGRLFVRFGKGSSKPTGGEPSTGLGLAIAKEIVQAHGGKIDVSGDKGQGLTFRLTLPVHTKVISSA